MTHGWDPLVQPVSPTAPVYRSGRDLGFYPAGFVAVLRWASLGIRSRRASHAVQCSLSRRKCEDLSLWRPVKGDSSLKSNLGASDPGAGARAR